MIVDTRKREEQAELLALMGNAKRLQILDTLLREEINVTDLAAMMGLSQSALSQHLTKLRGKKLVKTRRDAQTVYYSSNDEGVRQILALLDQIAAADHVGERAA